MLSRIARALLNFLFPIYCVSCGKEKTHCCVSCLEKIPSFHQDNNIIAAASFREKSSFAELIHRFKYNGAKEIGGILVSFFPDNLYLKLPSKSTFVPVPLHPRRYRFRGFNQSEILASELQRRFNKPVSNILIRNRYTQPQVELDGLKRLSNVSAAFSLKHAECKPDPDATYFIVDDVCTTGATLNECATVLKQNGARRIYGLVIGRTV